MKEIIESIIASTRKVPAIKLDRTVHCLNCAYHTSYNTLDKVKEIKVYQALAFGMVLVELTCPVCNKKSVFLSEHNISDNKIRHFTPLYRPDFPILRDIFKVFAPPFKELERTFVDTGFGCAFSPIVQNVLRYFFTENFERLDWKIYSHKYFLDRCKILNSNPYSIGLLKYLTLLDEVGMKVPPQYARVLGTLLELILSPNVLAGSMRSIGFYILLHAYIEDNFKE